MRPRLLHGIGSPQSVLETSATRHHMIGTPAYLPGGRRFMYARNTGSTVLARGELLAQPALAANHVNLATVTASLTVGSNVTGAVTLGATAAAKNLYADGYLFVVDGGGEGTYYMIREHAAIASAGAGVFTLYDPVAVVSDASTEVSLIKNVYSDPVVCPTSQAAIPIGIPLVAVPDSSSTTTFPDGQYFWVQTWGPSLAWITATPAVGVTMQPSTTTAGFLIAIDQVEGTATMNVAQQIAQMLTVGINTEVQAVFLRITA